MKIFILLGEKSSKLKDIDLFCKAFNDNGLKLQKIMADDINISLSDKSCIYINGVKQSLPDAVISAYFGNMDSHNLYVTQMLESMGVLCINSSSCLTLARDKLKTFIKIKQHLPEIFLPKTVLYSKNITENILKETTGFPLVVKIINGSKGMGVETADNFSEAITKAEFLKKKFNDDIIFQEYIKSSYGKDLRFIICGGKYITSFIRSSSEGFTSNVAQGGKITPFSADTELIAAAEKLAALLDINLGSIDFLFGSDNRFYFCESNGMPGLNYTQAYTDLGLENPMNLICRNIKKQIENNKDLGVSPQNPDNFLKKIE